LLVAGHAENDMYTFGLLGRMSPTQYGLRKGKGTRDCLVDGDVLTSFEMKKQTVAAFLDIRGVYNNVLIEELPLGVFRFMWSLLWC
jgi:hypothetical protein